jgi:hypothetical protein
LLLLALPLAADDLKSARAAGQSFLALIDAGNYTEAYRGCAEVLTKSVSEKDFAAQIGAVRAQLGALKSRKLRKATPSDKVPGAPAGTKFIVLEYSSSYANKPGVTELVSPVLEKDGKWRVAGYRFK